MAQYVPDVTDVDIERVVRRDYPPELQGAVHELIRGVEVRDRPRVVLACLKNANGDFPKLQGDLTNAGGYWREIIGAAEYPNYTRQMFRADRLSAEEKDRIIERDKDQYLRWLHGGGAPENIPENRNEA